MIELINGSISVGSDLFKFLAFVKDIAESNVISAYFKYDGAKVEGDDNIKVVLHAQANNDEVFWLSVEPLRDYVFLRVPLNAQGVQELIGTRIGDTQPDPIYWRWAANPKAGVVLGDYEPANAKVDFIIIGYRPKALVKYFSSQKK